MRLDRLLDGLEGAVVLPALGGSGAGSLGPRPDAAAVDVVAIAYDSRAVGPGALFCCVPGGSFDGHDFAGAAAAAGAVAVLVERQLEVDVPQILTPSVRATMPVLAARLAGDPSRALTAVGVTGTNGKTTVTHLLRAVFETHGWKAAVIGTLTGSRTTPEAPDLQAQLAALRDGGTQAVALEVSSHALAQHRVDGIEFAAATFTNLTQDHLDFHGTMDEYFAAKARLFEPDRARVAVVNVDDPWGLRLTTMVRGPLERFSLADAGNLHTGPGGSTFTWRGQAMALQLAGRLNVENALAAATTAAALDIRPDEIAHGLATLAGVPGRFERVGGDRAQPFTVVVDYAHTPDGLEQVLTAGRELLAGGHRLLVVFGCGGDRDTAKRPMMGEIATRLADRAYLTSDNPRSEDPMAIIDQVRGGVVHTERLVVEPDRAAAIAIAIDDAAPGDLVVIAGKGHETGQDVGGVVTDFDDRVVARQLLDAAMKAIFIAGGVALLASLVITPLLIGWLKAHNIGQQIREDGPQGHFTKAGTPTMGGVAIVASAFLGYVVCHLARVGAVFTYDGLLVMAVVLGAGLVGLVDDYLSVRYQRNLGLNKRTKFLGLLIVAVVFAVLAVTVAHANTHLSFTRFNNFNLDLGKVGMAILAVLMIEATTNAVNFTDGLDGLAAGSSAFAFGAFTVIGFWQLRHPYYQVPHALDLALVAVCMVGGITGFLWWNAAPARIIMGDTGSLSIGAGIAGLAVFENVHLLLPILCGLFVAEALSVVIQIVSFRVFHRRVFRMAPIHHHFELADWPETTIVIRFWILAGLCAAIALGIFYADFLTLHLAD